MSEKKQKKLSSTKQLNKRTSSFFNSEVVELKNNLIVNDLFSQNSFTV